MSLRKKTGNNNKPRPANAGQPGNLPDKPGSINDEREPKGANTPADHSEDSDVDTEELSEEEQLAAATAVRQDDSDETSDEESDDNDPDSDKETDADEAKGDKSKEAPAVSVQAYADTTPAASGVEKMFRVATSEDYTTYIGDRYWYFKANKAQNVPAHVKDKLRKAGKLAPL